MENYVKQIRCDKCKKVIREYSNQGVKNEVKVFFETTLFTDVPVKSVHHIFCSRECLQDEIDHFDKLLNRNEQGNMSLDIEMTDLRKQEELD